MTASELFRETAGALALAAVIGALFGLLVTVANPLAINEYEDGSAVVCIGSQPMAVRDAESQVWLPASDNTTCR